MSKLRKLSTEHLICFSALLNEESLTKKEMPKNDS